MKSKTRKNRQDHTEFRAIGFERARERALNESLANPPASPISPPALSIASSWEEQDIIEKHLYDKFAKGQRRVDQEPVVVSTCRRRMTLATSYIRRPFRQDTRIDNDECFRRNFIEKFTFWDKTVENVDESTLKNTSRQFSEYVAQYLNNNTFPRTEISQDARTPNVFEFTTPGSSYFVELREGGECVIIPNSKSSLYGVVEFEKAKKLRDELQVRISPLNHCQKPSITNNFDRMKKYSLVHFDSIEQKEMCRDVRESPICAPGALDYTKTKNTASIGVKYNKRYDKIGSALLTLARADDVQFAENVLLKHGLLLRYAVDKYGEECTKMHLTNIPTFVNSDEYLNWFMHTIFDKNKIEFKRVRFESTRAQRLSPKNSFIGNNIDPKFIMSYDLMRLIYRAKLRPKLGIITHRDLKQFVNSPENLPFRVTDTDLGNFEHLITAHFNEENSVLGQQLGALSLMNMNDLDFMRFTASRMLPAQISPQYRRMLPLPRSVRNVCQVGVEAFDKEMKVMMTQHYEVNVRDKNIDRSMVRIVDEYVGESDDGFTGIEGWPPWIVDYCVEELSRVFAPEVIDLSEEEETFFYGVGEAYLRSFVNRHSVIVDFDRYRGKLSIYGDATNQFVKELEEFKLKRLTICLKAEISLCEPHCESVMMGMLNTTVVGQIGCYLKANVWIESQTLMFYGSCRSYEVLKNMLFSMKNEILSSLCINSFDYSTCPVCRCTISDNFYRLENCGHTYCYGCMCNMVKSIVGMARFDTKCCFEECEMTISPIDIKRIILGDENRVKLLDAEKLQMLNARAIEYIVTKPGSAFKVCKTVDCIGILQNSKDLEENQVHCVKCEKTYCAQCLEEPHPHVESCELYERMRRDVDYSLKTFTSATGDEKFRRCPTDKCEAVIEKDEGCNHVECPYCHCHFCWICLVRTEKVNELYKHMHDEHGGTGGEWPIDMEDHDLLVGVDVDETLDVDFQHMLLEHHQQQQQN